AATPAAQAPASARPRPRSIVTGRPCRFVNRIRFIYRSPMPAPKPKRLDQVLSASAGRLGSVTAHARRLADAAQRLTDCLPAELAAHCRLAGLDDGRVVVAVDSPAWA